MNRRQRKKKDTKGLTLIFSCEMLCKQETYANLERMAGGSRAKKIKIMKERQAKCSK